MFQSKQISLIALFVFAHKSLVVIGSDSSVRDEEMLRKTAERICQRGYNLGFFESPDKRYCCNCKEGEYLTKLCDESHLANPQSRVCEPCPFNPNNPDEQTWMDVENNSTACKRAIPGNYCSQFLNAHRENGSRIKDGRCVCDDGFHLANQTASSVVGGCQKDSPCPAGYQPYVASNGKHDTLCEACPEGYFSNYSSVTDPCIAWTRCNKQEYVVLEGNKTHDRVCETHQDTEPAESITTASSPLSGGVIGAIVACTVVIGLTLVAVCVCFCQKRQCVGQRSVCKTMIYKKCQQSDAEEGKTDTGHNSDSGNGTDGQDTGYSDLPVAANEDRSLMQNKRHSDMEEGVVKIKDDIEESAPQAALAQPPTSDGPCSEPTLNKEIFSHLFPNFDEELNEAHEDGCRNCCINRRLNDHEVGGKMFRSLENCDTDELRNFLRPFGLSDQQDQDLDEENRKRERYRSKMVSHVIRREGRNLTPRYILGKEISANGIRDKMLKAFFEGLSPCR